MTNKEVSFTADGQVYTVRYTTNALCKLEEQLGKPFTRLAVDLETNNMGFRELQSLLWAGLEGHRMKSQRDRPPFTLEMAGDIADDAGGLNAIADKLTEAFRRAFPPATEEGGGKDLEKSTNPTQ